MYIDMFFTISCVLFIFFCLSFGQEIAQKQCDIYSNGIQRQQIKRSEQTIHPRFDDIFGGNKSVAAEFRFMAALGYGDINNLEWECGGALISEKFVLTAAHCSYHRGLGPIRLIRLGTIDLTLPIGEKPALDINPKRVYIHPQYKPPSIYNDIALVELENIVNFSSTVSPVCLHTYFQLTDSRVTAMGWGRLEFAGERSDDLMKATISISPQEVCRKKYTSTPRLRFGIRSATQICAGGGDRDTCEGDSGGPLLMEIGNKRTIVGITSFGIPCGLTDSPGVYTRISAFVPWIEKIVWQ